MIDIDKTLGHEASQRAGIEAFFKTINRTPAKELAAQIKTDLTFMVNQAVNSYVANPTKPGATMVLSQLSGYMAELADLTGRLAVVAQQEGYRLDVRDAAESGDLSKLADSMANISAAVDEERAQKAKRSRSVKAAAAGVNL